MARFLLYLDKEKMRAFLVWLLTIFSAQISYFNNLKIFNIKAKLSIQSLVGSLSSELEER